LNRQHDAIGGRYQLQQFKPKERTSPSSQPGWCAKRSHWS